MPNEIHITTTILLPEKPEAKYHTSTVCAVESNETLLAAFTGHLAVLQKELESFEIAMKRNKKGNQ